MRTSLLPGLVAALARNRRAPAGARAPVRTRQGVRARDRGRAPLETPRIAAVACGDAHAPSSGASTRAPVDFHDLKGDLDSLAALGRRDARIPSRRAAWGHPGRSAEVLRDGRRDRLDRPTAPAPATGEAIRNLVETYT